MRKQSFAITAAVAAVVVGGVAGGLNEARATVVPHGISQVPIDAGAIAADPALASYHSYDLQVSISPGDHWYRSTLHFDLGGVGTFYAPPAFDADTGLQQLALSEPYLKYDTFVSNISLIDPGPSAIDGGVNGGPAIMPRASNAKDLIDISWEGRATANPISGIQDVARMTLFRPAGAPSIITGSVAGSSNPDQPYYFRASYDGGEFQDFTYFAPEPGSLLAAAVALAALAMRRRRLPCQC